MVVILLGAIVLFVVIWVLMRKYCPAPSGQKASVDGEAPSGVAQVPHLQQPTRTGDAAPITQPQVLADHKTTEPTAEVTSDKPRSGGSSVEPLADGAMSPGRRFTNAARRASVAVSRAVREQTANMLEALSSGPEGVQTQAVEDHKKPETEEPPPYKPCSGTASPEMAEEGAASPGRRFANAARRASVAVSRAVKLQTTTILESLSTGGEAVPARAFVDRKTSPTREPQPDRLRIAGESINDSPEGAHSPGLRFANEARKPSAQAFADHKTSQAEGPQPDRVRFGGESANDSPEGAHSPGRRLTNAARKPSMGVSWAAKQQTTNMLEALSTGSEAANTQALNERKTIEKSEEQPCDKDRRGTATADHPAEGVLSPGRRFVNAARRASVAVSQAVRAQTTSILESLSTGVDMVQVPSGETTPTRKASAPTEQGGEAKPTVAVAPAKDGGVADTDAKGHKSPSIPGPQSPVRSASIAATLTGKPGDVAKVEAAREKKPLEGKDEAKSSQPPRRSGSDVAPSRDCTAAASGGGGTEAKKGALTPPDGINVAAGMSSPRAHSSDHSPADESALQSPEAASNIGKPSHRHRRKSKKKSLAGGAASGHLAHSPVLSDIRKSSVKPPSANHKA